MPVLSSFLSSMFLSPLPPAAVATKGGRSHLSILLCLIQRLCCTLSLSLPLPASLVLVSFSFASLLPLFSTTFPRLSLIIAWIASRPLVWSLLGRKQATSPINSSPASRLLCLPFSASLSGSPALFCVRLAVSSQASRAQAAPLSTDWCLLLMINGARSQSQRRRLRIV